MQNQSQKREIHEYVMYHSLIGHDIDIVTSKNPNQVGLKGKIIYESANFFYLDVKGSIKRILKRNITFRMKYEGKALNIDGSLLVSTIINRIKKMK